MGTGPFSNSDHQALRGPDKLREAMRLALEALRRVKITVGMPTYMNIKQGREESFAQFVDKVSAAIDQTPDVQEWIKGALLRQCLLQNCNPATRTILASLPGNASIEKMLERMRRVPVAPQAMLVEAVKESVEAVKQLEEALQEGQEQQMQALATLAPVRAASTARTGPAPARKITCFRCDHP
ncbi:hypothetical protein HGM15179_020499 [Zosterops borbonicus]|uniref:Retroviral nucleocapsid Gag protein p24 C-terminal domain-containing protein n=1 Tax=Zosterops borbonicus TaxID=364589 RepID=A0A8K1FYE8_9PASS|nr:hypothetical protein HGM15179_020499 [Zosterops borbonicus]